MPAIKKSIYNTLLKDISGIYTKANLEAKKSLTRILTQGYWEIGKRIVTVEQNNEIRAGYGESLLLRLTDDLTKTHGQGFSLTNLKNMRKFYLTYPKGQPVDQLEWSKHCVLLGIEDSQTRRRFIQQTVKENWTREELINHLKEKHLIESKPLQKSSSKTKATTVNTKPLTPKRGTLYAYRLKAVDGSLEIDCGFKITRKVMLNSLSAMKEGSIIICEKSNDGYKILPSNKNAKALYTYKAKIIRVVDGDTLVVRIDCGFDIKVEQALRLRGINTPEIKAAEGQKAKQFVSGKLNKKDTIIIRTSTADKYDRYLADVFYVKGNDEVFLNQELLDKGLAQIY